MRRHSYDYDSELFVSGLDYEPPERRVLPSTFILGHFMIQANNWTIFNSNLSYFAYAEHSSRTMIDFRNTGSIYLF